MMKNSNFKKREIKGYVYIDGKRVTYLKEGVRRKRFFPGDRYINPETEFCNINYNLLNEEKRKEYNKLVLGIEEFEENE